LQFFAEEAVRMKITNLEFREDRVFISHPQTLEGQWENSPYLDENDFFPGDEKSDVNLTKQLL
jgi:hypothetical protein